MIRVSRQKTFGHSKSTCFASKQQQRGSINIWHLDPLRTLVYLDRRLPGPKLKSYTYIEDVLHTSPVVRSGLVTFAPMGRRSPALYSDGVSAHDSTRDIVTRSSTGVAVLFFFFRVLSTPPAWLTEV